jgi:hypothetical protein
MDIYALMMYIIPSIGASLGPFSFLCSFFGYGIHIRPGVGQKTYKAQNGGNVLFLLFGGFSSGRRLFGDFWRLFLHEMGACMPGMAHWAFLDVFLLMIYVYGWWVFFSRKGMNWVGGKDLRMFGDTLIC